MLFPIQFNAIAGGAALGGFDPDARTIISAIITAGVTPTAAQQSGISAFVAGMKADSLWTPMIALYGYVGGTAATHAINWKNPGTNNLTFSGTVTHNANGITGSADGFGDTGLTPLAVGALGGASVYMRVAPTGDNNQPVGVVSGALQYGMVFNVTSAQNYGLWSNAASLAVVSAAPTAGMFSINRTATTALRLDKNGVQAATDATLSADAAPNDRNFYFLATNNAGTAANFSDENDALSALHPALTEPQSLAFYNRVQALQTALGRQV